MNQMQTTPNQKNQIPATQASSQAEQILASDVLIPQLWLMQGLSELVTTGKAAAGDIIRSSDQAKVGGPNKALEFIPLTFQNKWVIQEKVGKKFEYRKTLIRDGGLDDHRKELTDQTGENLPWEFRHNGTEWKRVKTLNVFALLVDDIKAQQEEFQKFQETGEVPDLNKTLLPVMISFRSTSYNAGKAVVSHFMKALSPEMVKYGVKPYQYTMTLKCFQDKNDLGTFYVYEVGPGRKAQKVVKEAGKPDHGVPEQELSSEWQQRLSAGKNIQVDEREAASVDATKERAGDRY